MVYSRLTDIEGLTPHDIVIRDEAVQQFHRFRSIDDFANFYGEAVATAKKLKTNPHMHEVVRANCIQRVRFDLDGKSDPDEDLVSNIIEATIAIYNESYPATVPIDESMFIVYDNCRNYGADFTKYKYSYHILTPIYGTLEAISQFTNLVHGRVEDMIGHGEYMDRGVCKRIQNFRLPLSSKPDEADQPKIAETNATFIDGLLGWYGKTSRPSIVIEPILDIPKSITRISVDHDTDAGIILDLLRQHIAGFDDTWTLRNEVGGCFNFTRHQPSFCELCQRQHDHDNTLFVTVGPSTSKPVYIHCRHNRPDAKIKIGRIGDHSSQAAAQVLQAALSATAFDIIQPATVLQCVENVYSEPQLRQFEDAQLLFVQANMKMGKTKQLIDFINRVNPPKIVFISFRQTFSTSILSRLNEHLTTPFESYLALEVPQIDLNVHPRIVIQVDSLYRLFDGIDVDLLILDESESILEQFSSPHIRQLETVLAKFKQLCMCAERIVAMDANLGPRTINNLHRLRCATAFTGGIPFAVKHVNTFKNAVDEKFYVMPDRNQMFGKIIDYLYRNKKVVVCTNSLEASKMLLQLLRETFTCTMATNTASATVPSSDKVIRVASYTSETSPTIKQRHFADVDKYWSEVDILIYTPTVTAGISFEKHHFDVMFGLFTSASCTVETCRQMMGRIRNLNDHTTFLNLQHDGRVYITNRDILSRCFERAEILMNADQSLFVKSVTEDGEIVRERHLCFDLMVDNIVHRNVSRSRFIPLMIQQIRQTGATVELFVEEQVASVDSKSLAERQRELEALEISAATVLDNATYLSFTQIIQQRRQGYQDITPDDMISYRKTSLMRSYDVAESLVTTKFVRVFNSATRTQAFHAMRKLREAIQFNMPAKKRLADVTGNFTEREKLAITLHSDLGLTCISFEPIQVNLAPLSVKYRDKWEAWRLTYDLPASASITMILSSILQVIGVQAVGSQGTVRIISDRSIIALLFCGAYWEQVV